MNSLTAKKIEMKKIILITLLILGFARANAQEGTSALTAKYDGGDIILNYKPFNKNADSVTINVYRKGTMGEIQIRTNKKISTKTNTLFADTSTRKAQGVYQYRVEAMINNQVVDKKDVWAYAFAPDIRPVVDPFRVINLNNTNQVFLKWNIANGFMVQNIIVKRSRKKDGDYKVIANLNGLDSMYIDKVNEANEPFFYRLDMTVYNSDAIYTSASIYVLPNYAITPTKVLNVKAEQMRNAVVISWTNSDENSRAFYVQKRTENTGDFVLSSSAITLNKQNKYQWVDTASNLQNNKMYQYFVVAQSSSFDKSAPSDTVTVSYKNKTIPLSAPQDLRILSANDTTYHLAWSTDSIRNENNTAFQVYVKKSTDADFKPIPNMVSANLNFIEIPKPANGNLYKVKALQGDRQSAFSMPFAYVNIHENNFGPKYLKAAKIDKGLYIKWLINPSLSIKNYKLYKWDGKNYNLIEVINADQEGTLTQNYQAGQLNLYKLTAVNKNNIESESSDVLQVN